MSLNPSSPVRGTPDRGYWVILLVEDDPDIRTIVNFALGSDPEICLAEADRGSLALDYLRGTDPPDLILLDNNLPDILGTELLALIRQLYNGLGSRVAFFSAAVRDHEINSYLVAGAKGVLKKPFDPLCLSSEIKNLLEFVA